jgi:hypothetical protein
VRGAIRVLTEQAENDHHAGPDLHAHREEPVLIGRQLRAANERAVGEETPRAGAAPRLVVVTEAVTVAAGDAPRLARPWVNGEVVPQAGTVVGWTAGQPVLTPYDDCVLIMPTLVHAGPGATLLRFGRSS